MTSVTADLTPLSSDDDAAIAESALRRVRESKLDEAEETLLINNIEWAAPEAFYIAFSGEMTNTARINKPQPQ